MGILVRKLLVVTALVSMALESFVPAMLSTTAAQAPVPVPVRGWESQAPQEAAWSLAAPTAAVVACNALTVGRRRCRKSAVVARRFFDSPTAATSSVKKVESYKDLDDKWIDSADLGFDPLNVSITAGTFDGANKSPQAIYYNYRESEVKHGRFAMVGFLAIFCEAADRSAVLSQLGLGSEDSLDGTLGLDEVQAPVLLAGLGVQALAEYNKQSNEADDDWKSVEYTPDRCPGDLDFDPLSLGKGPKADVKGLHNIEVNTGRLAMIGLTSFLFKEFLIKDL